jgi:hypothetical protein
VNIPSPDCQFHENSPDDLTQRHETMCPACGSIWSPELLDSMLLIHRSTGPVRHPFSSSSVRSNPSKAIIVVCGAGLVLCLALTLTMTLVGWFFAGVVSTLVTGLAMLPFETNPGPVERGLTSPQLGNDRPAGEDTSTEPRPLAASHQNQGSPSLAIQTHSPEPVHPFY